MISWKALETGVQAAAILGLTMEVAVITGASLFPAGIGAAKLFWNKAIIQAATRNSTTKITEIAKSQFSHLSKAFLSAKKSLGVNQEALKLARELNFTFTTMERMSRPHRYVPRDILAKVMVREGSILKVQKMPFKLLNRSSSIKNHTGLKLFIMNQKKE